MWKWLRKFLPINTECSCKAQRYEQVLYMRRKNGERGWYTFCKECYTAIKLGDTKAEAVIALSKLRKKLGS
jgi:hypothetical protein